MDTRSYPEPNRLSVLMAAILLAYALARFINLPPLVFPFNLFGIDLPFQINFQTLGGYRCSRDGCQRKYLVDLGSPGIQAGTDRLA